MVVHVRMAEQRCRIVLVRVGRWDVIDIPMEVVSFGYFLVTEVGLWVRQERKRQHGGASSWILGSHWKIEQKG